MPLSLKTMLKKFVHKGQITQEEYDALIKKLDGHDKEVRARVINEFAEWIWDDLDGHCFDSMKELTEQFEAYLAEQLKEE